MSEKFEDLIAELEGRPATGKTLSIKPGYQGEFCGDPFHRILIVDNDEDVVTNFIQELKSTIPNANYYVWYIHSGKESDTEALLQWITLQSEFDAIFLDGALGDQTNGFVLAESIKKHTGKEYYPIAILTADYSAIQKEASKNREYQIILKFKEAVNHTLKRLVVQLPEIRGVVRRRMWSDLHFSMAKSLQMGSSSKDLAILMGEFFERHFDVCGWYFRQLKNVTLDAVAMKDIFSATDKLLTKGAPRFQRDLINQVSEDPWCVRNNLSSQDCAPINQMEGHHVIAARLGSSQDGQNGIITIYRKPGTREFHDEDAKELHHVALQLKASMESEKLLKLQRETASTITKIVEAKSSPVVAEEVVDFLDSYVNSSRIPGFLNKSSLRLFRRGTGDLYRWGQEDEDIIRSGKVDPLVKGNMSKDTYPEAINISDQSSAYALAVRDAKPILYPDVDNSDITYLRTSSDAKSCLIVPILHESACIGAINLEASVTNFYTELDLSLCEAIASTAASGIFRRRADRFLKEFSRIAAVAVKPGPEEPTSPDEILEQSVEALYAFCGFSNLVFVSKIPERESLIVTQGWTGNGERAQKDNRNIVNIWNSKLLEQKNNTYVSIVQNDTSSKRVFFTANADVIGKDDGDDNIRASGRPTLSQIVVKIDTGGNSKLMLSLLFEHPRPMPTSHLEILEDFAAFMSAIYQAEQEGIEILGDFILVDKLEARMGLVYSQIHHTTVGFLSRLASKIDRKLDQEEPSADILNEIREQLANVENTVRDTKVLSSVPKTKVVNVNEIWKENALQLQKDADDAKVSVALPEQSIVLHADKNLLQMVLFNLVENAIKYAGPNTTVELKMNGNELYVCDNGVGVRNEDKHKLMRVGYTTAPTGTGQGLVLCRLTMELMGGGLRYDDNKTKGACFVIELPQGDL